ncbi:MAG: hypothetical protein OXK17_03205 [Thaumarchaeota archaeon]|nr:hypothetical protein [Nitrososphaerota archaeon]
MNARSIEAVLFAILVTSIAFPATHMVNATDVTDRNNENKEELKKRIQALEESTDPREQAEKDYYQSALNIVEKTELRPQATSEEEIREIDQEIGRDYDALVQYIKENGSYITATSTSRSNTLSSTNYLTMSYSVTENVNTPPVTKTTSGTHIFSTAHSRNDCYAISSGTTSGTLTDIGNSQLLTVYVSYPSSIKSGGFPNCNIHDWSYGQIGFVDVFGRTVCVSTVSNSLGWHDGICRDWSSVGSLTIAAANGRYSENTWYAIFPAIGLVL